MTHHNRVTHLSDRALRQETRTADRYFKTATCGYELTSRRERRTADFWARHYLACRIEQARREKMRERPSIMQLGSSPSGA